MENATPMGPRKQAKDSRKICERGVPGNFYLAQHIYCIYIIYIYKTVTKLSMMGISDDLTVNSGLEKGTHLNDRIST